MTDSSSRKPREFWIIDKSEKGTSFYCYEHNPFPNNDRAKVIHTKEINPALDLAYEECEKALDLIANPGTQSLYECRSEARSALTALRKARGE